jgi:2-phospho-L-lactate guanylyltransferase
MKRLAWAVVPAKCPEQGKSRLRPILDDRQRALFARALLEHVLGVLAGSGLFEGLLVATDCDEVSELARAYGAASLHDGGATSLAGVIDQALAEVARRGAATAVVIMADLPHVGGGDLEELLAESGQHDVVVVRDHQGRHTNALALTPPTVIPTCFGRDDSFRAHCDAARAASLRLSVLDNGRIAFDVDGPEDHARLGDAFARR